MEKDWMSFQRLAVLYVVQMIPPRPLSCFFPKISCVLTNKCNQDAEGINQDQKDFLDLVIWSVNLWSAFL